MNEPSEAYQALSQFIKLITPLNDFMVSSAYMFEFTFEWIHKIWNIQLMRIQRVKRHKNDFLDRKAEH